MQIDPAVIKTTFKLSDGTQLRCGRGMLSVIHVLSAEFRYTKFTHILWVYC